MDDHELNQELTELYSSKQYDECIERCKAILSKEPLNLQALLYMGDICLDRHELDECIRYCDTVIKYIDERIYFVWMCRGQALCLQMKLDEAIESFREAVKYNPSHRNTWAYLALTLYLQGKKDFAFALLDEVEKKVEELRGRFTLIKGFIERDDGNIDDALMHFIQGGMSVDPASENYEEDKQLYAEQINETLKNDNV